MKRGAALLLAALLTMGLAGCDDSEKEKGLVQIELGKACFDAGGQYVYNGWSGGWLCEFRRVEK